MTGSVCSCPVYLELSLPPKVSSPAKDDVMLGFSQRPNSGAASSLSCMSWKNGGVAVILAMAGNPRPCTMSLHQMANCMALTAKCNDSMVCMAHKLRMLSSTGLRHSCCCRDSYGMRARGLLPVTQPAHGWLMRISYIAMSFWPIKSSWLMHYLS